MGAYNQYGYETFKQYVEAANLASVVHIAVINGHMNISMHNSLGDKVEDVRSSSDLSLSNSPVYAPSYSIMSPNTYVMLDLYR
jgi:hypothetical protein